MKGLHMRKYMRRRLLKLTAAVVVCWLLVTLMSRSKLEQDSTDDNEIRIRFTQQKEKLKLNKLQELQKTLFKNLSRPGEELLISGDVNSQ